MKQENEFNYRLVDLNNKGRKGTYVYVKQKGQKNSYYRYTEGMPIDEYVNYYKAKKKGEKPTTNLFNLRKRYSMPAKKKSIRKTITKEGSGEPLNKIIKKGMSKSILTNAMYATENQINRSYKTMLSSLVKDKGLLDVLIQEQNMTKIKHRIQVNVEFISNEGENLGSGTVIGKTTRQVIDELKGMYKRGDTYDYPDAMMNKGYQWNHRQKGILSKIRLTTIFRKGI